jgi:NAD-dependent dihydropyrimidine dehydrogenase PreA subunit
VKKLPTILVCRCAQAQVLPPETRQRVLEALQARGAAVEVVDDLCGLAARQDPRLKRLAQEEGLAVIACHERAVRWLFAAAGAPLPAEAAVHDLRTAEAEAILSRLADGAVDNGNSAAVPAAPKRGDDTWVPWFPVIDYDRCKNCRQCLQFCLFGVYGADADGTVRVVKPASCKTNCPACARICPHAAIIFPKYAEGYISGDPTPPPPNPEPPIDFSSLAGLDLHEALRRRSALLAARRQKEGRP